MDTVAILNKMSQDRRFKKLFEDKELLKEFTHDLNVVSNSKGLREDCKKYIRKQNDLHRYANIAKMFAQIPKMRFEAKPELVDRNLMGDHPETIMIEDALSFYAELDRLTDNKFSLLDKVRPIIASAQFSPTEESRIGYKVKNGMRYPYLYINTEPKIENRLALIHELAHALDEQYLQGNKIDVDINKVYFPHKLAKEYMIFNRNIRGEEVDFLMDYHKGEYYPDQFTGEILSIFIEKLAKDYLMHKHSNDEEFCETLSKHEIRDHNLNIFSAKMAYFDHLITLALAGSNKKIKSYANNEILHETGKIWNVKWIVSKARQLRRIVNSNSEYVPQYEMRYLIGEIVAEALYQQYLEAVAIDNKEESGEAVKRLLGKVMDVNDNFVNIYKLKGKDSTAKNQIDIITEYFGLDNIETLLEDYLNKMDMIKLLTDF